MENQKLIYQKILAVMSDIKAVGKNQTHPEGNFAFRGIDDIYNALHPLFQKHGVFVTTEVLAQPTNIKGSELRTILDVKFTFHTSDGSSVFSIVKGEAIDKDSDKAISKAMSVAHKICLIQMFLIPTYDNKPAVKIIDTKKNVIVDNRQWLSVKDFNAAILDIKMGKQGIYEKLNKEYKIRNSYRKELINAKSILKKNPQDLEKQPPQQKEYKF